MKSTLTFLVLSICVIAQDAQIAPLSSRFPGTDPLHDITVYTNSDHTLVPAQPEADTRKVSRPKCLHNTDILSLRQAGFSDEVIIARIKSSLGLYEMGTDDLLNL